MQGTILPLSLKPSVCVCVCFFFFFWGGGGGSIGLRACGMGFMGPGSAFHGLGFRA